MQGDGRALDSHLSVRNAIAVNALKTLPAGALYFAFEPVGFGIIDG
jgi:hypothetical protein